jgi:hypothetical protein
LWISPGTLLASASASGSCAKAGQQRALGGQRQHLPEQADRRPCRLHARDKGTRHAQGEGLAPSMANACGVRPSSASSSSLSLITFCSASCQGSRLRIFALPIGRASRYHGALHFSTFHEGCNGKLFYQRIQIGPESHAGR